MGREGVIGDTGALLRQLEMLSWWLDKLERDVHERDGGGEL